MEHVKLLHTEIGDTAVCTVDINRLKYAEDGREWTFFGSIFKGSDGVYTLRSYSGVFRRNDLIDLARIAQAAANLIEHKGDA